MTLTDVVAERNDPDVEPARNQDVILDGHEVTMLVCLDRTCVVVVDGERRLVAMTRVHVDPTTVRWQRAERWQFKEGSRQLAIHHARRKAAKAAVAS